MSGGRKDKETNRMDERDLENGEEKETHHPKDEMFID